MLGRRLIELLAANRDRYRVRALVAGRNAFLLAEQAIALGAEVAVVADSSAYAALRDALAGTGIEVAAGAEAVVAAAALPADWTMAAITGAAGLAPTLAAINRGAICWPGQQGSSGLRRRSDAARGARSRGDAVARRF